METFKTCLSEFTELQVTVQSLMKDDCEKEAEHLDWFEPKLMNLKGFLENLQTRLDGKDEEREQEDSVEPNDSPSQISRKRVKKGCSEAASEATSSGLSKTFSAS